MSFEAMNFKRKVRACHCPYNIKPRIGRCASFGYQEMPKGGVLKLPWDSRTGLLWRVESACG